MNLTFEGYLRLTEGGGDHPYNVVLRKESDYCEYDQYDKSDKMIRRRTQEIYLAELIGKELLGLSVADSYGDWETVLGSGDYECGKVKITIEQI